MVTADHQSPAPHPAAPELRGIAAPLQQPDGHAADEQQQEQEPGDAQELGGEEIAHELPEPALRLRRDRDAETRGVEGVGEVHLLLALRGDGDRRHGGVQGAVGDPAQQPLQRELAPLVLQAQIAGDALPELDAEARPGSVRPAHRERRRLLRADPQRAVLGRGRGRQEQEAKEATHRSD
jgi:hypothetical protein